MSRVARALYSVEKPGLSRSRDVCGSMARWMLYLFPERDFTHPLNKGS
jgi:hypothetical protein